MKRVLILVVLLVAATMAMAQEATINTPVTRSSVAKVKLGSLNYNIESGQVVIGFAYKDSSNVAITDPGAYGLAAGVTIPSTSGVNGAICTTTIAGLATAMNNTRASETGTEARKQQFRILGYAGDQSCYGQAITLVP